MFAFLTTGPKPLVAPIHPKAMPVLLDEEDEANLPVRGSRRAGEALSVAVDVSATGAKRKRCRWRS